MNVKPSASFEAVLDEGTTGLAGTIRVKLIDNIGGTPIASSAASITERYFGGYVAVRTAPAAEGQYTLVWDDGTDDGILGVDDLVVTSNAPSDPPTGDTYADATELARILKIRNPSAEQTAAMERVLLTATGEIDSEIDLPEGSDPLSGWKLALAAEVCLERAIEHWGDEEHGFGVLGLGDTGPIYTARNSWERHANKLVPAKAQWGLA